MPPHAQLPVEPKCCSTSKYCQCRASQHFQATRALGFNLLARPAGSAILRSLRSYYSSGGWRALIVLALAECLFTLARKALAITVASVVTIMIHDRIQ